MTQDSDALISYIRSRQVAVKFQPCAWYGPEEGAVAVYFRNKPDYAKWIDDRLTLFLALDSDECVGFQIIAPKTQ